jgi:dipeptidyl aminopeptidase/acylaminoacyl peptidase
LSYLTSNFDRSAAEIIWSPDSKYIYFNASNEIHETIYRLDVQSKHIDVVYKEHVNAGLQISADGKTIFLKQERTELPTEIFAIDLKSGAEKQLTQVNAGLLAGLALQKPETFWSDGAEGAKVQSILLKPPFFDPNKKYPMIFLVHGGPQGHWNDEFHYRWNTQMFASRGYVVVAVNPRGSTGYGQKFTDEISGDWGGKVYTDLMNACDYALKNYSFIDTNEVFAAGASYGGYMMNWIMGHTNRFKAIVSHDGVFNLESMFGTTEELWFAIWENKGKPWENRSLYEKYSPHRFIQNCKTPVLVVEGAKDFRVPEDQAFQLFTSLQLLGVESNLLYFPDEFHFVTKPQNARLWWNTVLGWFEKHK